MASDIHRICTITGQKFVVTAAEQDHIAKFESLHPLLRLGDIPLPTIHPLEQARQMQSFVTLMSLFQSKSCLSGNALITRYNPQLGYKVSTREEFWSDAVDNTLVGRDYDFSRPFFEQWNELLYRCTLQPLVQISCENSLYVDSSSELQNCYLCFGMGQSQDCLYCLKSLYPLRNRNCVDCIGICDCELCYSCVHCDHAYACQHCQDCSDSYQCFGCVDVVGCQYCFGCVGLRQSQYYLFNQFVGKQAYEKFIKEANLGSYQSRMQYLKKCGEWIKSQDHKVSHIQHSYNVSGDYLKHCKNLYQCYFGESLEDCGWTTGAYGKDAWRSEVYQGQLSYNSVVLSGQLGFGNSINTGSENFYSYMIFGCNSCFGCAMLKQNSYCILNKQYSKAEYEELVPRVIAHMKRTGEWGQFLAPRYAPHLYEETQAWEWFGERIQNGNDVQNVKFRIQNSKFKMQNEECKIDAALFATQLPDHIGDIDSEKLVDVTLCCELTGRPFRLVKQEISFYQLQTIPLPRICWQERLRRLLQDAKFKI